MCVCSQYYYGLVGVASTFRVVEELALGIDSIDLHILYYHLCSGDRESINLVAKYSLLPAQMKSLQSC